MDERETAKARGSDSGWIVYHDYSIADGFLRRGERSKRFFGLRDYPKLYYPLAHPEIVEAFAKLNEGDQQAVVEFARHWGLLGYGGLVAHHPGWFDVDKDGQRALRKESWRDDDPLEWIWAHARTVRHVLELMRLLTDGKGTQLADALRRIPHEDARVVALPVVHLWFDVALGIEPIVTIPGTRMGRGVTIISSHDPWSEAPREVAAKLISHILTYNLDGVAPMIGVSLPKSETLERTYHIPSLLTAIYWHLADAAVGQKSYIQCGYCGMWTEQTNARQRYCRNNAFGESLCSLKARQARWQKKRIRVQKGEQV